MNRAEITKTLGELLIRDKLSGTYWASEVTFDYGMKNVRRVDFMKYEPVNQSTAGIEKGTFTAYEVKSSVADYRSKNGHNFEMERNYYVMPFDVFWKLKTELPNIGVYCPIPKKLRHLNLTEIAGNHMDSFPPLSEDDYEMVNIWGCTTRQQRDISVAKCLFYMLRSGK